MSQQPNPMFPEGLALNPEELGRKAVGMARTMIGVLAVIALAIGIALLVWPGKSLVVLGALTGAFFVITGVVRIAVGIFASGVPSGFRILNIIFGALLLLGGIVALKNLEAATAVLTLIVIVLIGVGWIIDGIVTLAQTGRSHGGAWGYVRGAFGIIAGIVVLVVPTWSAFALVIITGVTLVLIGIAGIVQAVMLGKALEDEGPVTIDQ